MFGEKSAKSNKRSLFNLLVFKVSSEQRNHLVVPRRKMMAPLNKHCRVEMENVEKGDGQAQGMCSS